MARRALLMGNAAYPADAGLTDLLCPINDVDGLAAVLEEPGLGGFEVVNPLRDATSAEARRALVSFLREAQPGDTVLFYYSGHGKLDGSFALHLCTRESEVDLLEATALPIGFVHDLLAKCRAGNSVMLLDCCFSGAAGGVRGRGNVDDALRLAVEGTGTYLLTASGSVETAQEKEGDRYGVFTKHVIEGLKSGAADREGRGFVTMDDLYDYVARAVRADSPQRPTRQVGGHGDIVIARSGRDSRRDRAEVARRLLYGHVADGALDPVLAQAAVAALSEPPAAQSHFAAAVEAAVLRYLDRHLTLGEFVSAYWTARLSVPEAPPPEPVKPPAPASASRKRAPRKPRPPTAPTDQERRAREEMEALGFAIYDESAVGDSIDDAALAGFSKLSSRLRPAIVELDLRGSTITGLDPLRGIPLTSLDLSECGSITSIAPLKGMPLASLFLSWCEGITSLASLKGMPLTSLSLSGCKGIKSLAPLRGMPLEWLQLFGCEGITSLEPLRNMPLASLSLSYCDNVTSLDALAGMPLTELQLSRCKRITDLAPLADMPLTELDLSSSEGIADLTPLAGMPLVSLDLSDCEGLTSLEGLQGMPLTSLNLGGCGEITSLEPIRGMPLTSLRISFCKRITSLDALAGMRLTALDLTYCEAITSLDCLKGIPLTSLDLSNCSRITSLEGLKGMALTSLDLRHCTGITSLEPLRGMPLTELRLNYCSGITSLEPLRGMPLTFIRVSCAWNIASLAPLKGMNITIKGASSQLHATLQ